MNIMIVSDNIKFSSGVGNQTKHIVKNLIGRGHCVFTIGVVNTNNPHEILPAETHTFDSGETCLIYPSSRYDNMFIWNHVIKEHSIDSIIIFTDPYRYESFWRTSYTITSKIPVMYINVWDTYLAPQPMGKWHWNLPYYESVNTIANISKQTQWFVEECFKSPAHFNKPYITYVGHGSDSDTFKPLIPEEVKVVRDKIFRGQEFDFVVLQNSRNQARKEFPSLIEAFRLFVERLTPETRGKCALLLHTEPSTEYGTNLVEVCSSLAPGVNVFISNDRVSEPILNQLYNIADVVTNISSAEGFGLSANEACLAGTPVILNDTGGLRDQMGSYDKEGNLVTTWTPDIKKLDCGEWAKKLKNTRRIIGNPHTAYLYDEYIDIDDLSDKIMEWYNTPPWRREELGLKGREFHIQEGLTSKQFSTNVADCVEKMVEEFVPTPLFRTYKV